MSKPAIPDGKDARIDAFVETFVEQFEAWVHIYFLILNGEKEEAAKLRYDQPLTEQVVSILGLIIGSAAGTLFGQTSGGSKCGNTAGNWIGKKLHAIKNDTKREEAANVLSDLIKWQRENRDDFRMQLIRAALNVFSSYEYQLRSVNADNKKWKKGIIILAKEGVIRAVNYCGDPYTSKPLQIYETIAKGVIYGESKSKLPDFKGTIPLTGEPDLVYRSDPDKLQKWKSSSVYVKPGIVLNDGTYYEKDKSSKAKKYGYRKLLSWEEWAEMKGYQKVDNPGSRFKDYSYQFEHVTPEKVTEIFEKMKEASEKSSCENMKQVRDSILNEIKELSGKIDETDGSTKSLLLDVEKIVSDFNVEKHFEGIKKSLDEISTRMSEGNHENKTLHLVTQLAVEGVAQKADEIMSSISKLTVAEDVKIWFDVENPIDLFTGRKKELKELHDKIQRSTKSNISKTVISGLGGIGKSQLAKQYANLCQTEYSYQYENVIWINSETETDLTDSFTLLATSQLQIKEMDVNGKRKTIERMLHEIYEILSKRNTLIIFDNAERNKFFRKFLPSKIYPHNTKFYVLITSRIKEWEQDIEMMQINELSFEDAQELVRKGLELDEHDDSQEGDIKLLLRKLQNYPLSIIQAIAVIKDEGVTGDYSIKDYLAEFDKRPKDFFSSELFQDWSVDPYSRTTYTTWDITKTKIAEDKTYGSLALKLLEIISYIAPQNIRRDMMFDFMDRNEANLKGSIRLLVKYSMVNGTRKQEAMYIHRLVQKVTRLRLKMENREEDLFSFLFSVLMKKCEYYDQNVAKATDRDEIRDSIPHLESLLIRIKRRLNSPQKDKNFYINLLTAITKLVAYARNYLGGMANFRRVIEDSLTLQEKYYGPDHPEVAETLRYLAIITGGRVKIEMFERALRIEEKCYGLDDWRVGRILANLANAYGGFGDIKKQKELLERSLAVKENYFGSDHHEVANTLGDLAIAYYALGDISKMIDLSEKALTLKENYYGPDHYHTATTLYNLGITYGMLGDVEKQKTFLERAIAIEKKHFGQDHMNIGNTMFHLGCAYGFVGNFEKKKEYLEKCLFIQETKCSYNHSMIAIVLVELGNACGGLGDFEMQKTLLEKGLKMQEKIYGPEDYVIAMTLESLGNTYQRLGDSKGEELLNKASAIKKKCGVDKSNNDLSDRQMLAKVVSFKEDS